MLKYFSIAAMVAVLIIFATLGVAGQYYVDANKFIQPKLTQLTPEAQRQVTCLASNIYFEARSEPREGQIAVAFVTLNRVESSEFPNNICDVVKQKTRVERIGDKRVVCQFSWYCESRPKWQYYNMLLTNDTSSKYNDVLEVAIHVYANQEKLKDPTNGSLYYHADYVKPNWRNLEKHVTIGRHIFYRTKESI
jgi:spore germination cell wall hydrolase CwlJ-like protein